MLVDTGHLEEKKPGSCPRGAHSLCKIPRGTCAMMMRGVASQNAEKCKGLRAKTGKDTFLEKGAPELKLKG